MNIMKSGWSLILEEGTKKLYKSYECKDFIAAIGFISQVALISQELDHHAEIYNCYNKVTIKLSTHDENKVTQKDRKMAAMIEKRWLA